KTQYAYDRTGRLTGIFSADGTEQRTAYDERGRVTVVTQGRRATEYHYPDERTVTRCILPPEEERDKHPDEQLLKTTYRYNAAGELEHITLPGGETLAFTRDEAGREIRREGSGGFVQAQEWNSANQLISQRAGYYPASSAPGTPPSLYTALSRDYRYDNAGNLTDVTERGDTGSETRREYRTDRNGQITTVTVTGSGRGAGEGNEYYRYDSCGYLENQAAGRYRTGGDGLYRRGHRLKRSGNREYDYDAAGRMVSRTTQRDGYRPEREQFRWDSRDQLTGYSNGKGEQWTYRYDGSGRRTEKRCDSKGLRTTYLWDGDSIAEIREYRHDKLSSVRHLVFSGFELVSQQVSRERQAHPTEPVRWVTRTVHAVSEPTGRPLMFFNSAGKAVKRPAAVTLWGQLTATSTADYDQPYRREDEEADPGLLYAGQWWDAESGLCYNRFRYYEPESGMYLVSDPLGLAGGVNTYSYVHNPLSWCDPLGLAACPELYDWYKYNRSQGMTAAQAHQAIKNASPQDVFNYALHRQGLSGHNYPVNFKEKFTAGNYKYEVRAHDVNLNAPPGSNSANGPIYRVGRSQNGVNPATNQGYGWEYGSPDGSWYHTSVLKPNGPNYNPGAANDTHIPLPTGVIP
ncbi:hypothetical protein D4F64_24205, partial [Salmonella enterica subsp. enterica]|nr:hypothetical protein [Salmonella enterica subsp. enterica]